MSRTPSEPRPGSDRTRSAFTLVELLVAIGIIALLIGILLPAVGRARESGKSVKCKSNLHQIGIAFESYLADFKGQGYIAQKLTAGQVKLPSNAYADISSSWSYSTTPTSTATYTFDVNGGWMTRYMRGNLATYVCPSFTQDDLYALNAGVQTVASYAVNGTVTVTPGVYGYRMTQVTSTANTLLAADAASLPYFQKSGLTAITFPTAALQTPTTVPPTSFVHGRHLRHASACWFDGHVTSEPVYLYHADDVNPVGFTPLMQTVANRETLGTLTPATAADRIFVNPTVTRSTANFYFTVNKRADAH